MLRKPHLPHLPPLLAVLAAALMLIACTGGSGGTKTIVMEVAGPAQADITYGIGTDQSQELGKVLPWKKTTTSSADPLIVVLSAQSKAEAGEITCKLTIGGKIVKENKSTGQFAVVTCSSG